MEGYKETNLGWLPEDWEEVKLGEIAEINMGQSPKGDSYNDQRIGMPLLNGPTEFQKRFPKKVQWTSQPTKTAMPGDFLLCVRGSSIGRYNISNDHYCIGRGLAAISAGATVKQGYLEYAIEKNIPELGCVSQTFADIESDESDFDHGEVVFCCFLIPGGNSSGLLKPSNQSLYNVPVPCMSGLKSWAFFLFCASLLPL